MSAPGTPAPPTTPVPVQVAPAAAPAAPVPGAAVPAAAAPAASAVPAVETVDTSDQNGGVDGVVTMQPLDSAPGTPAPEFTTLPAVTPEPVPEPVPEEEPPKPTWAHGLFGCFDMDMKLLGLSMCCPCITFGANAELLGEDWMLYCLFCILPGPMCYFGPYIRNKIRRAFEIEATDQEDVLAYLFCPCLAIIQETQQLKSAGMKPGGDALNRE